MTPSNRRKLVDVKVSDALKRRYPSKHYVYVIDVTWDDGSNTVIFRRYSKFFDFQISLLELHPLEGGLKDPAARTIPFLPGKVLFRRSHIRDVAMKRLKPIDEYCKSLVGLPLHISQSNHVLDFFETKPEDINPPENSIRKGKGDSDIGEISGPISLEQYVAVADYTRTQPKELSVVARQHLEVIEKHENGWWFVSDDEGERGWIPGVYLEKMDGTRENLITNESEPGQGEKYITSAKFTAGNPDEVSFGLGVMVEVLQKNLEGWWQISYQGKTGYAPASYLEKPSDVVLRKSGALNCNEHGVEIISSVHELKAHRRSLPSGTINAVGPSPLAAPSPLSSSASSSPKRHHTVANRHSKEYHSACLSSAATFLSKPSSQVLPPPKRASVRGSGVQKPQVPPPLPPTFVSEPVYEYVARAPFKANIPDGVSFDQDAAIEVIEKSPGGWWYVVTDGTEGWAPASYIEKQFKAKSTPPERPKPPKPVEPAKVPLARSNSDSRRSSFSPALRPLPPVPKEGVTSSGDDARPDEAERTGSSQPQPQSRVKSPGSNTRFSVGNLKQSSTPNAPANPAGKETNTSVAPKRNVTATQSSPTSTQSVVAKPRNPAFGRTTPGRPASSPAAESAAPKLPLKPKFPAKPASSVRAGKPQPPKPPALKKPVCRNNSTGSIKSGGGANAPEVDFRSVLKPANRQQQEAKEASVTGGKTAATKTANLPGRPATPKQANGVKPSPLTNGRPKPVSSVAKKPVSATRSKPTAGGAASKPNSVSSLKSKFQNPGAASAAANNGGPACPKKPQVPRAKPAPLKSTKPVLKRLPNNDSAATASNGNNNSNNDDVMVGRVENDYVTPDILASKQSYRGSPDGQCDEGFIEGSKAEVGAKFVAVADFEPLDPSEMGFELGAEAVLKETAQNDWWYVQINTECGWVPSAYFKPPHPAPSPDKTPQIAEPIAPVIPPALTDSDAIYSEIDDPSLLRPASGGDSPGRYLAISEFEAGDETMLNMAVGDVLQLVEETDTGWWFVSVSFSNVTNAGSEGWVPADHLQPL